MRSGFTFIGVLLIAGVFQLTYILLNPFFGLIMDAQNQLSSMFADIHGVYDLIWAIMPVVVIFSIVLWVFVESQPPGDQ